MGEIRDCCSQLKGAGIEVHVEVQAAVLLNGLGPSFENFVASVSQHYRRKEEVVFDDLVSQLFDEERRQVEIEEPMALLSRSRPTGQRKPLMCCHCNRPGHKEENCWTKHPEKRPRTATTLAF